MTTTSDSVVRALLEDEDADFDLDKTALRDGSPIPATGFAHKLDYEPLADFQFNDIGPLVDTMTPLWQMITRQKQQDKVMLYVVDDASANESTLGVSKFRQFAAETGQLSSGLDDILQAVERSTPESRDDFVFFALIFNRDSIVQTGQFP